MPVRGLHGNLTPRASEVCATESKSKHRGVQQSSHRLSACPQASEGASQGAGAPRATPAASAGNARPGTRRLHPTAGRASGPRGQGRDRRRPPGNHRGPSSLCCDGFRNTNLVFQES